jgi:hypothetical protein
LLHQEQVPVRRAPVHSSKMTPYLCLIPYAFLWITQYIEGTHNARTLNPMNTRMQPYP